MVVGAGLKNEIRAITTGKSWGSGAYCDASFFDPGRWVLTSILCHFLDFSGLALFSICSLLVALNIFTKLVGGWEDALKILATSPQPPGRQGQHLCSGARQLS